MVVLSVMVLGLMILIAPDSVKARMQCPDQAYEDCFAQGRNVNPETCECQGCLGLPASDCTENGGYLDETTCQCVYGPKYYCGNNPAICNPWEQCINGYCQ